MVGKVRAAGSPGFPEAEGSAMAARGRPGQFRHGAFRLWNCTETLVMGHVRFRREAGVPG